MKDLATVVAEHELFRGLSDRHVELLAGCAQNVAFRAGAWLFREDTPANNFFLLRHGRVALEIAIPGMSQVIIDTFGPGEVIGWSWMVTPYRWHFDGEALEPVAALQFDAACMRAKFTDDAVLGYELLNRFLPLVVDRLQATRVRLLDLYGDVGART